MKKCQAVVLAAGEGKRMKSDLPKVAHEIFGKPLIRYVVDEVKAAGVKKVVVVIGHGSQLVERCLEGAGVEFALQKEQHGTGDAVSAALKYLDPDRKETLVMCGDAPLVTRKSIKNMVNRNRKKKAAVTVLTGIVEDPKGYGRIIRDPSDNVARIVEEKEASSGEKEVNEVNSGSYVFATKFLLENIGKLKKDNKQSEYYLTDLVYRAFFEGLTVTGYKSTDSREVWGINSREDLANASVVISERVADKLMKKGVTLEDPFNVYIGPDVRIGMDSFVEPGVIMRGNVKIGKNVRIGTGSCIEESRIGDGTEIRPYCVITHAIIGKGASVGPFAHLRPESVLMDEVRVGNFVEVKKSKLKRGSKANHLTYIGDASIGQNVNVGAGTITCNYDGLKKHRTEISDGVFIGSDTQLVAPVRVGKGALVGAGTTVTENVPPFSLAISRVQQKNIEDWVIKKMPDLLKKAGIPLPSKKMKSGRH